MKTKVFFTVLMLAIFLNSPGLASAIIGVSPANINFKNVLRGGYAERDVMISVGNAEPVMITVEPVGETASWIVGEKNFSISDGQPYYFKLKILPPPDIPNGIYNGAIRIHTSALGKSIEGHATAVTRASVDLSISVEITDIEIITCRAADFAVRSSELKEPVFFSVSIMNDGNIRLKPRISFNVWDVEQSFIIKKFEFVGQEILPTTEGIVNFNMENDLDVGQYWVDVVAEDCFASDTLTFDVLETGSLRANGILNRIISVPYASVGENVPIYVSFSNTGEKDVNAQFKGKVNLGSSIVDVLESEKLLVPVGKEGNFTLYFTPKKAGTYVASGRVFYENKRTYEGSTKVFIREKSKSILGIVFYLIGTLIILILLYKVNVERKKYIRRLNELRRVG